MDKIAQELVRIAKELTANNSNLGSANSYYRVTGSFKLFTLTKYERSGYSHGSTPLLRPIYTPTTAKVNDEIWNLYGGIFFVSDGKMWGCSMQLRDFAPFEKNHPAAEKFPLEKLSEITDGSQQSAKIVKV